MKTAILFATKHGTTEHLARLIAYKLVGDTQFINLKSSPKIDLSKFDRVIIGGSIHAGMIQKKVRTFCAKNEAVLLTKPLGLFISCMEPDAAKQQVEFDNAFPLSLRNAASAHGILGGEFLFDRLSFLERMVIKKVAGVTESISKLNEPAILKFVEDFESAGDM